MSVTTSLSAFSESPPPTGGGSEQPTASSGSTRSSNATLFPNEASLLRLASAVLSEISDDWETERAYLNMEARVCAHHRHPCSP